MKNPSSSESEAPSPEISTWLVAGATFNLRISEEAEIFNVLVKTVWPLFSILPSCSKIFALPTA